MKTFILTPSALHNNPTDLHTVKSKLFNLVESSFIINLAYIYKFYMFRVG